LEIANNGDVETLLYDNKVKLKFVNSTHRYYVHILDQSGAWQKNTFPSGVTSILKTLYDQSDLLEWYSSMASGDIVKYLAPEQADKEWLDKAFMALYMGKTPEYNPKMITITQSLTNLVKLYEVGKNAPLNRSKYGKDVGTQTHEAVDRYHKTGEAFIDKTGIELNDTAAQKSLDMYVKWFEQSGLEVVASEVTVYSIKHNYAGTLDRIYKRPDGQLVMGDFKTSNLSRKAPMGIQTQYWSQLGAYMVAYREEHNVTFADAVIVNSPKKGTIKIGYASDMGLTPLQLEKTWLDDLQAMKNHKQIIKAQQTLKSRATEI